MSINAQNIGLALGWLLVGWVSLQGFLFSIRAARQRARGRREFDLQRADFRRRVEAAARAARAAKSISEWTGWRPFRVAAIVDESSDVKSFYFTPVDGRALLPYGPGQYLTFRLPAEENAAPLVRCYSLSDRPRQDYYRTTVRLVRGSEAAFVRKSTEPVEPSPNPSLKGRGNAAEPFLSKGRGSSYFHERVRVGDELDVRAPAGTFLIDPLSKDPVVLVGAGIGVTPLVGMLEAFVQTGRRREVYAVFGFRNSREHPFKEHLKRLAETNPWIHMHVSYSNPLLEDVLYQDYNHRGRVTVERLRTLLPSNNFQYYVCGPGQMMESLVPALWEWGVPESHVHFEAFGPASVKSTVRANGMHVQPCEVRFEKSNRAVMWDGSLTSLLEFGEAAGIAMPSGCRAGSCGECMMAIRGGAVTTIKAPGIPVPAGHCLTCISAPAGELVLDA